MQITLPLPIFQEQEWGMGHGSLVAKSVEFSSTLNIISSLVKTRIKKSTSCKPTQTFKYITLLNNNYRKSALFPLLSPTFLTQNLRSFKTQLSYVPASNCQSCPFHDLSIQRSLILFFGDIRTRWFPRVLHCLTVFFLRTDRKIPPISAHEV